MIHLGRKVRFSVVAGGGDDPVTNSWGGWPVTDRIAPWMSLSCTLSGELDPVCGYLCNIKLIDDAIRKKVIRPACDRSANMNCVQFLQFAWQELIDAFPEQSCLETLKLEASPTLDYCISARSPHVIQLSQQFEFAASHRLHNSDLSDEENRELFGKCNNPHGHGHNYVVEVSIQGTPDEQGTLVSLQKFEALVGELVIDKLDHKNLNVEIDEFQELNPSVESIAMVIWDMLEQPMAELDRGLARLQRVRVYETPKTWADYAGPESSS